MPWATDYKSQTRARIVASKDSAALLEACRGFLHRALDDLPDPPE